MTEYLNPLDFKQPLKLDVGAGGFSSDSSFTSVDLYTECDIKAPMWDIPLPNESVDVIVSMQSLEHVSKFQVIPTLAEWWRLLKVGGKLQALVPDLEWAVMFWLSHKDENDATGWPMDIIYGNQQHEGEFHKTGFTRKILWDYLSTGDWFVHKLDYLEGSGIVDGSKVIQRVINLEAEKVDTWSSRNKTNED